MPQKNKRPGYTARLLDRLVETVQNLAALVGVLAERLDDTLKRQQRQERIEEMLAISLEQMRKRQEEILEGQKELRESQAKILRFLEEERRPPRKKAA